MTRPIHLFLLLLPLAACWPGSAAAQQADGQPADEDGSSQQVEESDEAFRRRMELEDARRRDPGYVVPDDTSTPKQEKIDALPPESRENIRDQLVNIIVENGEWEPSDALKDYPYTPTEAAEKDDVLLKQEQEAWAEQVQKYNEREAAAFGAYHGPVPGPGNPTGEEGAGQSAAGAGQGVPGTAGGEAEDRGAVSAAAFQAGHSRPEEELSTAGVSESALDFLKGRGARQPAGQPPSVNAPSNAAAAMAQTGQSAAGVAPPTSEKDSQDTAGEKDPGEEGQESKEQEAGEKESSEKAAEIDLETPGILAIKDLEKLRGTGSGDDSGGNQR